jgi:tetratricopeptide (TPR) repeat protein
MICFRCLLCLVLCFAAWGASAQSASAGAPSQIAEELLSKAAEAESGGMYVEALSDYGAASRAAPTQANIVLRMGLLKGKSGDFEGAKKEFARAIELDPSLAEAHYNLGLALLGGAKQVPVWNEALEHFEAALKVRPDYPEASNMAGVCRLETGDAARAAELFRAALKAKPDAGGMHFNLGRALEAQGKPEDALAEYTTAVKDRQPYSEAEMAIGNLLYGKGDLPESAEHFKAALAANPEIEEGHYKLAKVLRGEGKTRDAQVELKLASALIQAKADVVMSTHLSNESLDRAKAGDIPGGIQLLRKALWLDPSNAIANYNLGLLLADAGNLEAATLELRKAISLAPIRGEFFASLAAIREKAGDLQGAIHAIEKAVMLRPDDAALMARLESLKRAQAQQGSNAAVDHQGTGASFGAVGDTADGHLAFAGELSGEGDTLGAVGELLRAAALEPARSEIRLNLGIARAQLGQPEAAELDFRKALLQKPGSAQAHIALGSLLMGNARNGDAAEEFRQALAIESGNADAARLLAQCSRAPRQ